jgi:hypothetical protein
MQPDTQGALTAAIATPTLRGTAKASRRDLGVERVARTSEQWPAR